MKGNLKDFSPTQILSLVSLAKKSGTLEVNRKDGTANLAFKDGKLVFTAMGDSDGSLVAILVRTGRINKDLAVNMARYAEKSGDKQLGLMLIQKKYFSQADIVQSIKRHALAAVTQFATWREGGFEFFTERQPDEGRITVPIDLENVIIQIARQQKLDEQLDEEIPSLDVSLKFTNRPNIKLSDLQLSKEEWRVLNFIRQDNTIRMIANKLNMSDKQIRRVVGSLREAGLIELAHARRQQAMSQDEKEKKRAIVGRLINHLQSMGAE